MSLNEMLPEPDAGVALHELQAQIGVVVPPDRALVPMVVEVVHEGFPEAAAEIRAAIERVQQGVRALDYCTVTTTDYEPPQAVSDLWVAEARLLAEIDLAGLDAVLPRMERLDACLRSWRTNASTQVHRKDKRLKPGSRLFLGEIVLSVDEPERHRPALLERWQARLQAAAEVEAPQWRPEDLRVASRGIVVATVRRLGGVRLELELFTDVVRPEGSRVPVHRVDG